MTLWWILLEGQEMGKYILEQLFTKKFFLHGYVISSIPF